MSDVEDVPMADADKDSQTAANALPQNGNSATTTEAANAAAATQVMAEEDLDTEYPNRPKNANPTLPFSALYLELFEPLLANKTKKTGPGARGPRALKPHEIRRNIIDRFISKWKRDVGNDIFPAFRLILCDKDRDRTVYHLKEQRIGKLLVKAMKINKDSEDGQSLVNWKTPGASVKSAGDFALRCHEVIKKRPLRTDPGTLTIEQVNDMLDQLSQTAQEDEQLPIITEFYKNMNPEEMMWLVRILLKQMKVGATEKTFFDAWHPDAHALFNVSSSLRRVCWELWDTEVRLEDETKGVNLMSCFQPQFAQFQKKSLVNAVKAMGGREFWIEEKLDGERMQMHYENGKFKFWSRKAKDYTYLYGAHWEDGGLARFIKPAFAKGVKSLILDGEMIEWDPKYHSVVAFGTLKTAALDVSNNPYSAGNRPIFRVFDILYLNGQCLIDYPLEERRKALEASITNVDGRLEVHPYLQAKEVSEIEAELQKVIATASEGLVLKNPRSVYRLNDRNDDWVKVKPEYMTEFGESLDCLIIGGYWGSGRRGNILSSYLCGLRVDGTWRKPNDDPMKFWSFFKVGGGFTANEYSLIWHRTEHDWIKWDKDNPPKQYIELAGGDQQFERPDVWIRPDKSIVVEVKGASIGATDRFRTQRTLRFPRFKKMRFDKDWKTALSLTSFLALKAQVDKEIGEKQLEVEQRKRGAKRVKKEYKVLGGDTSVKFEKPDVAAGKPLFMGYKFYVMSDSIGPGIKKTKEEIVNLIKTHGGRIFSNENAEPGIHVIADKNVVKVAALKRNNTHDMIRPKWIFDCIAQDEAERKAGLDGGYVLPLEPDYLFHAASDATRRAAFGNVDKWGDSYRRDIDTTQLSKLLDQISTSASFASDNQHPLPPVSSDEARAFRDSVMFDEEELESESYPGWLFKDCRVYVDQAQAAGLPPSAVESLIKFADGTVINDLTEDEGITQIVVDPLNRERLVELRGVISQFKGRIPRVVGTQWVEECLDARSLLDEERFAPPAFGEAMEVDGGGGGGG